MSIEQIYKAWQAVGADVAGLKWEDFLNALAEQPALVQGWKLALEVKNCHRIIKDLQKNREFVGLTDDDVEFLRHALVVGRSDIQAIEDKLKERNTCGHSTFVEAVEKIEAALAEIEAALAEQPARKSLTPEQKRDLWVAATIELPSQENCYYRGIADAEIFHGIQEQS